MKCTQSDVLPSSFPSAITFSSIRPFFFPSNSPPPLKFLFLFPKKKNILRIDCKNNLTWKKLQILLRGFVVFVLYIIYINIYIYTHKYIYIYIFFSWSHLWHMEVPGLGVELELQLQAHTTGTARPDLSCICDLHCSFWQCQMLNPLSHARD